MRRSINLVAILVALLLCSLSATAALPRNVAQGKIEKIISQAPLRSAVVGVFAVTAAGDTVAAVNPRQRMIPASNVKLITTGLALNTLGADFRFGTDLAYSGGIEEDGTLKGDLYIIGGGDPTTGSRSECAYALDRLFSEWAQMLGNAGIRRIEGRVIGDPRFFDSVVPENMGWTYDDLGTNYGAGILGLNFFENAQYFYVAPGPSEGSRPFIRPRYPDTPWMRYLNNSVTGQPGTGNSLTYFNTAFGPYGEFRGSFPADRSRGYTLECSNRFGAYTCAYYFHNYLKSKGISVSGGWADVSPSGNVRGSLTFSDAPGIAAAARGKLTVIGTGLSPKLSEIARDANFESDNFYAETLMRMMGKKIKGCAFYDECTEAEYSALRSMGLEPEGVCQLFDGSGLSRKNYVSADFFVRFLRAMMRTEAYGAFFDSLPVAGGRKGTLQTVLPSAPEALRSRIHAKSGSMNGIRCYSGYIVSSDGNPENTICFSVMLNNLIAKTWMVNPGIYAIIEALAVEN